MGERPLMGGGLATWSHPLCARGLPQLPEGGEIPDERKEAGTMPPMRWGYPSGYGGC